MRKVEKGLDQSFWWALRLWLPVVLLCAAATALDPDRQISQYAHTAWRVQDGAFSGTPHAITQTADGYLWVGTEGGLLRFDGVRFVPWTPPSGKKLPSTRVYSLLGASDGSLWIGTGLGLASWKNSDLVNYSEAPRIHRVHRASPGGPSLSSSKATSINIWMKCIPRMSRCRGRRMLS